VPFSYSKAHAEVIAQFVKKSLRLVANQQLAYSEALQYKARLIFELKGQSFMSTSEIVGGFAQNYILTADFAKCLVDLKLLASVFKRMEGGIALHEDVQVQLLPHLQCLEKLRKCLGARFFEVVQQVTGL